MRAAIPHVPNGRASALAVLACVNGLVLASAPAFATVNVNTAQQSELQSTRGLDKYRAKAIIEYRNQYGPYLSVADLAKAIGPAVAGKVASQVAFDGPPYVPPPQPAKPARKKP